MRRYAELLASLTLLAAACGGGGSGADAGPGGPTVDAALYPVECEATFGRSFILRSLALLPPGQGLDINGDGAPDNSIGFLWPIINPPWQQAIDDGIAMYLVDITGWDPLAPDDPDVSLATYLALDADDPPDTTNDLGGEGEFLVPADQYDVNCRPLSIDEHDVLEDGVVGLEADDWNFLAPYIGTIEFKNTRMQFTFNQTLDAFDAVLAAAWSMCSMSHTFIPQLGAASFLDLVANQGSPVPDVDSDGDGLEQLVGDGTYVVSCIDGDGTVIDGSTCSCDPRMADRYSMSITVDGVPATILGIYEP
jgi:hypothetical protein